MSENQALKRQLRSDITVTEHLIDTYSRIDMERVAQLQVKLAAYESQLLEIMVEENNTWLDNQSLQLLK